MRRKTPFFGPPDNGGLFDQNQQDYPSQVAKALALQSRLPAHLDSRIQLGLQLDDLTKPEFQHLRRRTLWEASLARTATAAQRVYGQLTPQPGMITVISRIILYNAEVVLQAIDIGLALGQAALSTMPSSPRDDRYWAGTSGAVASVGSTATPVAPIGQRLYIPPATLLVWDCEYVLSGGKGPAAPPNTVFAVVASAVNTGIFGGIQWTERAALPSESAA